MAEQWKPVVGHEGAYEVSSCGQVRSVDRIVMCRRKTGVFPKRLPGKRMALIPHPGDAYLRVWLSKSGAVTPHTVHALVAAAFLGPCPTGHEVCHRDCDGGNNTVGNLRYGTRGENREDSRRNGTLAVGERIAQSKLTAAQVRAIRAGAPGPYPVASRQLRRILARENWKHV